MSLGGCASGDSGCQTSLETIENVVHGCAIDEGNDIQCWGDNYYGQTDAPLGILTKISSGGLHSCGIDASQNISCWGDSFKGQAESF